MYLGVSRISRFGGWDCGMICFWVCFFCGFEDSMLRCMLYNVVGCEDKYIIDFVNEVWKILGVYEDGK